MVLFVSDESDVDSSTGPAGGGGGLLAIDPDVIQPSGRLIIQAAGILIGSTGGGFVSPGRPDVEAGATSSCSAATVLLPSGGPFRAMWMTAKVIEEPTAKYRTILLDIMTVMMQSNRVEYQPKNVT
jgi:hypothetical protein